MTTLLVARRAETDIRTIQAWWTTHREKAPHLFAQELADALEAITASPSLGTRYGMVAGMGVRRLILPRTRYHLYFSYDPAGDIVRLRAVWHAARGRPPALR